MAITWDQARTKMRGDLWRSSSGLSNDVCDRALHASILELEAERRWLWLEDLSTTVALAEDDDNMAIPANVASISSIAYINGASQDILTILPLARVRAAAQGTSAGAPAHYALAPREGKIFFDTVVPQGAQFELVATMRTTRDLDAAVAAGDTNVTLNREQTAVIANANHHACLTFLKNEQEAGRQRAAYDRLLDRLMQEEDEARADSYGGCIIPDTGYRDAAFGRYG